MCHNSVKKTPDFSQNLQRLVSGSNFCIPTVSLGLACDYFVAIEDAY